MKIALAQLNYHVGNFEQNEAKILATISKAELAGARLVVFSELSVCGYPPLDLLEQRDFITACEGALKRIAERCKTIAAIVGAPTINVGERGKRLFNSAYLLDKGTVQAVVHKTLLPTYDVFDEYRYFEPNAEFGVVSIDGVRIALTICEDLWNNTPVENSFAKSMMYRVSPMERLLAQQPDLMINIAASPFSYVQETTRNVVLRQNVQEYGIPLIYVNQVGANTELLFDGNSKVISAAGEIVLQCAEMKEDVQLVDTERLNAPIDEMPSTSNIHKIYNALVMGIGDYFAKNNFRQAVLGLSGGIDSAVVATLAVDALGANNVRGLLMPSQFSSDHSVSDAVALAKNLGIRHDIIPIASLADAFDASLKTVFEGRPFDVAEENIQARARGILLMAISNKFGHILLNTTNKSEAAVGYGTLYGDMNGGISILGDVYKTQVFELARFINRNEERIPQNSILKPPSAELRPDQKDSDSLPEYDILDGILYRFIEQKQSIAEIVAAGFDVATVERTVKMINRNEYKRFQLAPVLRVSTKAFGMGRRIPLVAKY